MSRLPLPKRRFWLFYTYAIASYVYGYFVIYKLTRYMSVKLAPYGLETVGTYLSGMALFMWVVAPLFTFFKGLGLNGQDWKPGGRLRRLFLIGSLLLLIGGAACLFPRELTITRSLAVQLADPDTIRPEVGGVLEEVYVKDNDRVKAGQPLAKLRNREVELRYSEALAKSQISEAIAQRAMGMENPAEYREALNMKAQSAASLKQEKADLEHLTLTSSIDGIVLARDLRSKVGSWLRPSEAFCQIAPVGTTRIAIPLGEQQVRYVKKGQLVELKTYAYPQKLIIAHVAEDPLMVAGKDLAPSLSSRREGDVVTGMDREGHEIPIERVFIAKIQVDDPEGLLRQGMSGRAKIFTGRHLFGKLLWQSLLDLVSLDYRF
jgi:multidrug resistance efflux pump